MIETLSHLLKQENRIGSSPYFYLQDSTQISLLEKHMVGIQFGIEVGFGFKPSHYNLVPNSPLIWLAYEQNENAVGLTASLLTNDQSESLPSNSAYFLLPKRASDQIIRSANYLLYVNPEYDTLFTDSIYLPPKSLLRNGQRVMMVITYHQDQEDEFGHYSQRFLRPRGYDTSMLTYHEGECPWVRANGQSDDGEGYYLFDYLHEEQNLDI